MPASATRDIPARIIAPIRGLEPRLRRIDWIAVAQWLIPFALVTYLGIEGGDPGGDIFIYSQVGILAWWVVLLGTLVAALPGRPLDRTSWIGLGAFTAFALWTTAGISWSDSAERSVVEVGRIATYLGILVLALRLQTRGAAKRVLAGTASGIAVIGILALLYRFLPDLFPTNELAAHLPGTRSRLAFPLGYWNGLASLIAVGLPLLVWLACSLERPALRGLAAAAATLMPLTILYTISRGGTIAAVLGVIVLFALHPERLRLALTMLPIGVGSLGLILAAGRWTELQDGLENSTATEQGLFMLAISIVVATAAGLLVTMLDRARRDELYDLPVIDPDRAGRTALIAGAVLVVAFVVAGGPGWLSDQFESFKGSTDPGVLADRFASISGNGRWQYWGAAADANSTAPLIGVGPGNYELWWAENGDLPGFIRSAHSLFMETLADVGIIGLLLLAGFFGTVLVAGVRKTMLSPDREREMLAGATAAAFAFTLATGVDWSWKLAVVAVVFLMIAAAIVGYREDDAWPSEEAPTTRITPPGPLRRYAPVVAVALACIAGIAAIFIPARGVELVDESQALVSAGDLDGALEKAKDAIDWQPYASRPWIQKAGVIELQADLAGAAAAAREAIANDPKDWRPYYTLARLETLRERIGPALKAYRQARDLNPRSLLFSTPDPAPGASTPSDTKIPTESDTLPEPTTTTPVPVPAPQPEPGRKP